MLFFLFSCFLSRAVNSPSIIFKENKGQWPKKVLFGADFYNTKFYVNKTGFNYCIYNSEELARAFSPNSENRQIHGHNYEVNLEGANFSSFKMNDQLSEYYNYFIGSDRQQWASHVKACKTLDFKNIYSGINLKVYSSFSNFKYDFIVSPNSNPELIKLNYNFIEGVEIRKGQLIIKTSVGEIIEEKPIAYQIINERKVFVKCEYKLSNNSVSFAFPDGYNTEYSLIIDPIVIACSYSGAAVMTLGTTSSYDLNGNIYLAGFTMNGYPVSTGAFQLNIAEVGDIFISCFNSNGSLKLFSTYLGGNYTNNANIHIRDIEIPLDIHASNNEITILGITTASNYPVTKNAFDTILNGRDDLVLTKLDITGSNLLASSFIGGSSREDVPQYLPFLYYQTHSEMIIDNQKNIYVISNTTSFDFPVTSGAFSSSLSGPSDAVVFKMDSSFTTLIWSTYLGGTNREDGVNIRPDGNGGVFVSGTTSSTDFPVTSAAYNQVTNSPITEDMYISHINNTGTGLISSTYLGTATTENALIMDVDAEHNVYICGVMASSSSFFTPTAGTYSTQSCNAIYKLDSALSNLVFRTTIGTATIYREIYHTAMQVDSCGNIYLAGYAWGSQTGTPDKFQNFAGGGGTDMYMMMFNPNCSSLKFASYFGGKGIPPTGWGTMGDFSWGKSHFDDKGVLYLAISANEFLPTTSLAYSPNYNDTTSAPKIYNDAFVKIDFQSYVNANSSYGANIIGCPPPFTANFVSSSNTGSSYWDFGDGNTSTSDSTSNTYSSLGTYSVLLVVTDTTTCNRVDSVRSLLNVVNPTSFDIGENIYLCPEGKLLLKSNVSAMSYSWSTGQTTQNILIDKPGTYSLTIFNGGCYTTDDVKVELGENKMAKFPNVITPNADGVNDFIDFTKFQFGEVEFIVYDRWGNERFRTTSPNEKWEPSELNNGTYFYVINYFSDCIDKFTTFKGFITLLK